MELTEQDLYDLKHNRPNLEAKARMATYQASMTDQDHIEAVDRLIPEAEKWADKRYIKAEKARKQAEKRGDDMVPVVPNWDKLFHSRMNELKQKKGLIN